MAKYLPPLFLLVAAAVGLLAVPFVEAGPGFLPFPAKYKGGAVANGGAIAGTVTVGSIPEIAPFEIPADMNVCDNAKVNPRLKVDAATKGLANVVVYIDGIEAGKALAKGEFTIDQKDCQYDPHVSIVPVKSKLRFGSSDPILHNVHMFQGTPEAPHAKTKDVLNAAMSNASVPDVPVSKRVMRKPGFYFVQCDAGHIWMSAYVWVVEHPYHVLTDAQGKYKLDDVPPGSYTLRFWHENWETNVQTRDGKVAGYTYGDPLRHSTAVKVEGGKTVTVDWTAAK